jgi:CRP/FNR family cyclic AMP-dependent transcriptional regulator
MRPLAVQPAAAFDLFQWLPDTILDEFGRLALRKSYPAGKWIYCQGDAGAEMFRIVSGVVRLSVMRLDGRELVYIMFGQNDVFGESSIIDGHSRPHTAEAHTNVEADVWTGAALTSLRVSHPEVSEALLQLMTRRMRVLSSFLAQANLDEVSRRLAARLLSAATSNGFNAASPQHLLHLSQGNLALMIGASRQSVNRALQELQHAGVLTVAYGTIVISDIARLQQAAGLI